jgi:hypothetical protein
MKILYANYGGVDCTNQIQSLVKNDSLKVRADNRIIGDPIVGVKKTLTINIDGVEHLVQEGDIFVYPKSSNTKLGIFYSNNSKPELFPAIKKSLQTIQIAAEGKADILTCMWNHEPSNPFFEYLAWTKTTSHLNQLLQILQLLYNAKKIKDYETVSFLEHDVLYPNGYFDYPEIQKGTVITNLNYLGLCKEGWQEVPVKHEPFHQMTMRFDDAVLHCESLLANALVTNSGLIEPQVPNIIRKTWNCINPAIHVNHGGHFTSHFSIYSKTDIKKVNPYWGNHEDYLDLFYK